MKRGAVTPTDAQSNKAPSHTRQARQDRPGLSWALLAAISIASIVSLSRLGYVWIDTGESEEAVRKCGLLFFWLWPTLSTFSVVFSVWAWGGPVRIAKIQHGQSIVTKTVYKDRPIIVNQDKERAKTIGEKMSDLVESLRERGRKKQLAKVPSYAHQALVAKVEHPETITEEGFWQEVYRVTNEMWNKPLTRPSFDAQYVNGQKAVYPKYKDLWHRLGWVGEKGNGAMYWLYDNRAAMYWRIPELRAIAEQDGWDFSPPLP